MLRSADAFDEIRPSASVYRGWTNVFETPEAVFREAMQRTIRQNITFDSKTC